MALPANLIIEKNKLSTGGAWLALIKITLTDGTIFRLAQNNEDVVFGGNTFTAFNFQLDTIKKNSSGELITMELRVSNITRLIQPYLEDLDGGIGSTIVLDIVSTKNLTEDYSDITVTFKVLAAHTTAAWVVFTLGVSSPLRQPFPLERYNALHCNHTYQKVSTSVNIECNYKPSKITGITLPSGAVVSITATAHLFTTGEIVEFAEVGGAIELNGNTYTVTRTGANTFTLDGTDGDDFTAWTSNGIVGFSECELTFEDCRERGNDPRFGGFVGLRGGGITVA